MKPISSEEYVKAKGGCCPACKSENIEGDEVVIDEGQALQTISCLDCEATWTDVHTLVRYSFLYLADGTLFPGSDK